MAKNINRKVTIYINGCDLLLFSYLCKVLDNTKWVIDCYKINYPLF